MSQKADPKYNSWFLALSGGWLPQRLSGDGLWLRGRNDHSWYSARQGLLGQRLLRPSDSRHVPCLVV